MFVEFIMSHVHEHPTVVTDTTTSIRHDYSTETGLIPNLQGGLHMMMMAVSISFNMK